MAVEITRNAWILQEKCWVDAVFQTLWSKRFVSRIIWKFIVFSPEQIESGLPLESSKKIRLVQSFDPSSEKVNGESTVNGSIFAELLQITLSIIADQPSVTISCSSLDSQVFQPATTPITVVEMSLNVWIPREKCWVDVVFPRQWSKLCPLKRMKCNRLQPQRDGERAATSISCWRFCRKED